MIYVLNSILVAVDWIENTLILSFSILVDLPAGRRIHNEFSPVPFVIKS